MENEGHKVSLAEFNYRRRNDAPQRTDDGCHILLVGIGLRSANGVSVPRMVLYA